MADESGAHFASDEDLLSRYALGRLTEAERRNVERHAMTCAGCRESLRMEMMIAAGAKRLGREELKSELRRRTGDERGHGRFLRVAGIAATIMLVAGVGAYYALFNGGVIAPVAPPLPPPVAKFEPPAPPAGPASPSPAQKDLVERFAHAAPSVVSEAKEKPIISPRVAAGRMEDAMKTREAPVRAEAAAGGKETGEFWSDGVVEGAAPAHDLGQSRSETNAFKKVEAVPKEETGRLSVPSLQARKDGSAQAEYRIRQMSTQMLPRERGQARRDQSTVPTLVDRKGGTTTMTLYLDSLVNDKDLEGAQVQAARGDSVIVTVGGKKILYSFPRGEEQSPVRRK